MARRFVEFQPDDEVRRDYLFWAPLGTSLLTSYGHEQLCRGLLSRAEQLAQTMPALDLGLVGTLAVGQSDYVRAFERTPFRQLAMTRQAVGAFESIGDTRNQITALNRLGQALGEMGDFDAGEKALREAVELAQRIRGPFAALQSALHLAALLAGTDEASKWDEADAIATNVLTTANLSAGYRGWALGIQAQISLLRDAYEKAVEQARAALALCIRLPLRYLWIQTLLVRGLVNLGRVTEAANVCVEINQMLQTRGGGYVDIHALLAIAETNAANHDMETARRYLRQTLDSINVRAADILDETMRRRYVNDVSENARARTLAPLWM
jgi:tetratricopeptide (TPR) repeat protein